MHDYKFDGEIHPFSENYAYISREIGEIAITENDNILNDAKLDFFKKYSEYLFLFDKEKVLAIIMDHLLSYGLRTPEDFTFIYKPKWKTDLLEFKGIFSLKFKRCKPDNIDNLSINEKINDLGIEE